MSKYIPFIIIVVLVIMLIAMVGIGFISLHTPKYLGCYHDDHPDRTFAKYPSAPDGNDLYMTRDECVDHVLLNAPKARYFGMQYARGDDNPSTGQCWYGLKKDISDLRPANDSCKGAEHPIGSAQQNAIYRI